MKQYLDLLNDILLTGANKTDRTGTGTYSVFGRQMRFDLQKGFPLLTTKKLSFKLIASELLWFINGDTNIKYLLENNNNIWNEWAFKNWISSDQYSGPDMTDFARRSQTDLQFKAVYDHEMYQFTSRILEDDEFAKVFGELGNIYGAQWRRWKTSRNTTIDQLNAAIYAIKHNPDSRRIIVTSWNPEDVPTAALPPCHVLYQFYVADGKLSCQLYQRSCDTFLGVPFNIASYALLTHLIAHECGLQVGEFIHTLGDTHIYKNHINQVNEQLIRTPRRLPRLLINPEKRSVFYFEVDDMAILDYTPYPTIKAPISV